MTTFKEAPKLKPCPFCGGAPWLRHFDGVSISCETCNLNFGHNCDESGGSGDFDTDAEAITAWNCRADLTPSLEQLKRWQREWLRDYTLLIETFGVAFNPSSQRCLLEIRDLIANLEAGE